MMMAVKRNEIVFYVASVALCAVSFVVLNQNTKLLLFPHKTAMEYLYNFKFVFVDNVGYEHSSGLFAISKNCSGVKLFINLFLIMVFGFLHRYTGTKRKIAAIAKFYLTALVLAFVVTLIRIAASVPFCTWEKFHLVHNVMSLGIHFAACLILYFFMEERAKV